MAAVVIGLATILIVVGFFRHEIDHLVANGEKQNLRFAALLANAVEREIVATINLSTDAKLDHDSLANRTATKRLHQTLSSIVIGLPILKVKVYNMDGLTVYSSQNSQIGEDKNAHPGFLSAAIRGKPSSKLTHREEFYSFNGIVNDREVVETYLPVNFDKQKVGAVFELYFDATADNDKVKREITMAIILLLSVFALMYGSMFFIVRRANGILRQQYAQIEKNEETAVLQKDALESARYEAEAASRAKSQFLANMSHELRTPLNAIIGFSSTMKERVFGDLGHEKYDEYVQDIANSGEHLLDLINDVLDVSAIEAGMLELHEEELECDKLIESALRLIKPRADSEGIEISKKLNFGACKLRADERRFKQIILNLLSNAVKFTPSGQRIEITTDVSRDHGAEIKISDQGSGMTEEEIEIALTPFGQVGGKRDEHLEGTGLGLPLTKALIEAHGGTLDFESQPNVGTTVTVNFPSERIVYTS